LPRGDRNENPNDIGFVALVHEDLRTHDGNWMEPGFWAVAVHRLGNQRMDVTSRVGRAPLSLLYRTLSTAVRWGWGIKLDYTVKLGRRVRIWHHGGMVLGARSIGNDVHIRQNTTFGVARRDRPWAKPIIEDGVDIGCGACILGATVVGHHSVVAANTLVSQDVPPHSLVLGVPGVVVKKLA
jgi:serine O-acetyltransferase